MSHYHRAACASLLLAGVIGTPFGAAAQSDDPDPSVSVADRSRPELDPLGIRAGSFFIFPSITLSGTYDSNAFATSNNEDSDVGAILSPNIAVRSNWSRHALNFSAGASGAAWAEYSENNYLDALAATDGRLDVTRNDRLTARLSIAREHDARDDPDDTDTTTVGDSGDRGNLTRYYRGRLNGAYRHNFARFFTVVGGGVQRLVYDDIGDREESRRDRWEYGPVGRLGYQVSPRIAAFVQGDYSWRWYNNSQFIDGEDQKRNNQGWRAAVGTEVDITDILFGEMSVGYEERDYDSDSFSDSSGFVANGSLTWNVTTLTSIILTAESGIDETTVVSDGSAAEGNLNNAVGLEVQHELLRNLLLNGTLGYAREDFQGAGRTDNTYEAGAGISYLLNRNFTLNANYRFTKRDSDDSTEEFDRNIVLVGITARL